MGKQKEAMAGNCGDCRKRPWCRTLCEPAKHYVEKGEVAPGGLTMDTQKRGQAVKPLKEVAAGDCDKCEKHAYCEKMCPEAIAYIDQDQVPQRELTVGIPEHSIEGMIKSKKRLTSDAQWDRDGSRSDGKHSSKSTWFYVPPAEPETPNREGREAPKLSDKEEAAVVLWTNDKALWSMQRIAKTLGISRNTVHKALKSSALID